MKCTSIKASNSYNDNGVQVWSVTYEGVTGSSSNDSDDNSTSEEENTTYELNGVTVRTVAGEFLALQRSTTPIKKQTFTIINNSASKLANPGSSYSSGGICISETIVKEVTKVNGVVTKTSYKHTIETEK